MESSVGKSFTFGIVDYIVFVCMLVVSAGIGVYFGFFSKSKNTTDEYLMGGKKMKTIPIAISLVASQLSAIAIVSVPAECYAYGFNYIFFIICVILVVPLLNYAIIPVFYQNNISNCYEYLQLRFNKQTRKIITASFVLNGCLISPVFMFVPALAFSQVTGTNIHIINAIVCTICIFYTMMGGIKAVVWTDVVQAGVMVCSVVLVAILGGSKAGGLGRVIENSIEGGRLDFYYGLDPRVRAGVINLFTGGLVFWTGHIGLNQSCVQRIVSLPSLEHARKALVIVGLGVVIFMSLNCFTGLIMFARYYGCDPVLAELVEKADKMMPFFIQDVMGHLRGMPGVFISCVFSAALSTMSATLNSLAGIVYFDYIKPFIRHSDARANAIMKCFVGVMGCYCILGGFVVEKFGSMLQLVLTIVGINAGAVVGVFLLGLFVPRVNGKVAFVSFGLTLATMIWIVVNAQMRFKAGIMRYDSLPTTLDRCIDFSYYEMIKNITTTTMTLSTPTTPLLITTAYSSNRPFSVYEISFYWYQVIGVVLVWTISIPLSYKWTPDTNQKYNPKLYAPFVQRYLPLNGASREEDLPLKTPHISSTITYTNTPNELPEKNHKELEKLS